MDNGVRIGLCGFTMAFEDYVREYRLVEVQQTFYEPPRDGTMRRWRAQAPMDFEFTVKAWQLVTHDASSPTYRRLRSPLAEVDRRSGRVPTVPDRPSSVGTDARVRRHPARHGDPSPMPGVVPPHRGQHRSPAYFPGDG